MHLIAHRTNTLKDLFHAYYLKGYRAFEIDVQPTRDHVLVVHHDDVSDIASVDLPCNTPTLAEFLRFAPVGIELNVEVKRYSGPIVAADVVAICNQYATRTYWFSSFDRDTYYALRQATLADVCLLHRSMDTYDPSHPDVVVHQSMLPFIHPPRAPTHSLYVYDVSRKNELSGLVRQYPWVAGWIVDE